MENTSSQEEIKAEGIADVNLQPVSEADLSAKGAEEEGANQDAKREEDKRKEEELENTRQDELKLLQGKLASIFDEQDEQILDLPILGNKLKPKDVFGKMRENKRYLLFTNKSLYTLNPKAYDAGLINKEKLIVKKFENQYLSHLIFFPKFDFETYKYIDLNQRNTFSIQNDFKQKKCKVILGFRENREPADGQAPFTESDIALDDITFHQVLELISACQKVHVEEKSKKETDKVEDQPGMRLMTQGNETETQQSVADRGFSVGASDNFFKVFVYEKYDQGKSRKDKETCQLKDFYRDKDSEAAQGIEKLDDLLSKGDTQYYIDMYYLFNPVANPMKTDGLTGTIVPKTNVMA